MRVLFAVSTDSIAQSIINKYQGMYKQILSAKSVYYFDAIVKELQRDKTYDRVVISEDLEPHTDNNYERIDNNIFNKLDRITDEASNVVEGEIPIIIIGADRRTKSDPLLTKLFGIGIYNVLVGQDRSLEDVCTLINKPRTKKEAKLYYNISDVNSVTYAPESADSVPEEEIQNILNHFNKIGKNEPVIVSSFNSIADQYSPEQLKIIIRHLPLTVRAVLETSSDKYKEYVTSGKAPGRKEGKEGEEKPAKKGVFSFFGRSSKSSNKSTYVPNKEKVINNNYVPNAVPNNIEVVPIEPINSALNNSENVGNVIIPKSVNINNSVQSSNNTSTGNGIVFSNTSTPASTPEVQPQANNIETPNNTEINNNVVPEQTATMPGLFEEAEQTTTVPNVVENNNVAQEPTSTMPSLFDEVEETTTQQNVVENNNMAQEPTSTMPNLFDEVEEQPEQINNAIEANPMVESSDVIPGLFDDVEESDVEEQNVADDNIVAEPKETSIQEVLENNSGATSLQGMQKRGRGRPRKYPKVEVDPNAPKRGRGRPRKAVTLNMGLTGSDQANVEAVKLSEFAEFQIKKPTEIFKENVIQNISNRYAINNFALNNTMPQMDMFNVNMNNDVVDNNPVAEEASQSVEANSDNISETIPGLFETEEVDSQDVDIVADNNTVEQVEKTENTDLGNNDIEIETDQTETVDAQSTEGEEIPGLFDIEAGNEPAQTNQVETVDVQSTEGEEIPGLFDIETGNEPAQTNQVETVDVPNTENEEIPGLFDIETGNEPAQTNQVETVDVPNPESDELPSLFDNIESMNEATETNQVETVETPNAENEELPSLFDNIESMNEATETNQVETVDASNTESEELPSLFDNMDSMDEATETNQIETVDASNTESEELPSLFDNMDSMNEVTETNQVETVDTSNTESEELPSLFDNMDSMDEATETNQAETVETPNTENEELPSLFDSMDGMNDNAETNNVEAPSTESDELPGLLDNQEQLESPFTLQKNNSKIQEVDLSASFNGTNKLVAFVGTSKNGTSFVINNLATLISQNNVNVAILDLTKNKNSYYVFTNNDPELMKKGKKCVEKLIDGFYEGITVQNNLTVYTSLPGEEEKFENVQAILGNLLKQYSLVILDCDFDTIPEYFKASQEVYLVQTYDILTIQPLTKFLRDCLDKGILSVDKLRIVINKEIRMKKLTKSLLIGGISTYNDPGLDYMKELFDPNMIMATSIPFDVDTYETYLENIVDCRISLKGYSNDFKQALAVLANMVYPLSTSRMQNNSQRLTRQNDFNKMNDTLSKMKNNF